MAAPPVFSSGIATLALLKDWWRSQGYSCFANYKNCPVLLAPRHYQLHVTNGPDTNTVLVTMWPTEKGTNYQIYTHDQSDTNNTWRVETNFLGIDSATTVAITLNGRTLDYIGGYGEDSDGDGLPDGYEVLATLTDPYLPDTGMTGTPDGYKDPDGDGFSNLQEMYNGTNPHHFDMPAGPQGFVADYADGTNEFTINWQAASGPVLDYVVSVFDQDTGSWAIIATNPPTQLNCVLANDPSYTGGYGACGLLCSIQAVYANGSTPANQLAALPVPVLAQAALAHGPGGKTYMLTSLLTSNLTGFDNDTFEEGESYPEVTAYFQNYGSYPSDNYFGETNIYISATQFTNGIAVLSDSQSPPYLWPFSYPYAQLQGGASGNEAGQGSLFPNVPFIDGTAQMKQNIQFLLRAANGSPFGYTVNSQNPQFPGYSSSLSYPTNYVYSTYYYIWPGNSYASGRATLDHFAPFEDNYFFRNFAFDASSINTNGTYQTGFEPAYYDYGYSQYTNPQFEFPTYDYVTQSNSAPIPGILSSTTTQWVGFFYGNYNDISHFGAYNSGGSMAMANYVNVYGLRYSALLLTLTNGTQAVLSPDNTVTGYNSGDFYLGTAPPQLQTVDYYFARPYNYNYVTDPYSGPMPGYQDGSFAVTNTTPSLMLGSVGTTMIIAGYAKQAVLNGNPNVFAYLGQYFSNALVMSNGIVTTNSAGILSEYGEFFPTVPGQAALMTMPDPDQTNIQGRCVVDIIRLSLDVNHDGIMDESYIGPDNTGYYWTTPFVFWANNDYDRLVLDSDGINYYDDSVASNSPAANSPATGKPTPDCDYRDGAGNRVIPSERDLQDFARLWVSGVSNTLSRLPSGSTVTLSWGGYGNSPTIDLFQAADADGGIGYLTNSTIASEQVDPIYCKYVGRIGPGSNLVLNSSQFSNHWAGDHYIWCGVSAGNDQLNLTITDRRGNLLAQSSQSIQIQDIKQMYERWTVGDGPGETPMTSVQPAGDDFSPGYPTQPFQYSYDPVYDTNDNYILYVHGWNMKVWEKDRFAESAFKRLYWQGYQGRFGVFRWPTDYGFTSELGITGSNPLTDPHNYDNSEFRAWQSATGLASKLADLNAHYPGHVYVLAHSMGNVVTGEALRLATNRVANTYVASQGAIPAHVYDGSVTNPYLIDFTHANTNLPSAFRKLTAAF